MSSGVLPIPDLCTFSLNQALSSDFFADFQTNLVTDLENHCGMHSTFSPPNLHIRKCNTSIILSG